MFRYFISWASRWTLFLPNLVIGSNVDADFHAKLFFMNRNDKNFERTPASAIK